MNSRHPGLRRMWKVGSVAHWLPPLPPLPVDPLDCTKPWFRLRETVLYRFCHESGPPERSRHDTTAKFHYFSSRVFFEWSHVGPHGPIWAHMGPYGSHMGPIWAHMGPYGSHVGPYGSHMGPYGSHMGSYGPIRAYMAL